ncbi:hypothetical protein PSHT_06693 [Puccinia striiformis]|uniref:CxC1-like cysteine cluster associated with KDZ transposases domain-containing protein n=1 Tax=Puccinia striiformis TaxID=27350 RepID=A0A2S4W4R3_9BASI|nr:hypothetical protein PSHT_06693 [Puccinia striiformis]
MRKPKPASRKPPDTLIQRLRRAQNATLNRVAFARLRSTQPVPEAPQPEPYPSDSVDDVEMSNNPYNPIWPINQMSKRLQMRSKGIKLAQPTDDDQPQRIDPAIESHQEQYRLLMKEYNWTRLMRSLHTWYMITKLNTNNWSGPNAYEEFPSPKCKCPPSKKKFRYVDLVDIYVQRRTQVEFCKCFELANKTTTHWLLKKFRLALRRRQETREQLDQLLSKQNPFKNPGRNYTISYFQKQWKHQQTFRADHTDGEQDRRDKLIKIYEHEGTLTTLRERLLDPELHLLPEKDIKKIIKSIEKVAAKLKADAEGVENLPSGDENTDKQRLKLLIWNSKQGLYIQAVQLRAERQPLLDAKKIGTRVGTELKEKILKAIRNRRPAVKKLIDKFNKLYSEFSRKFPTQPDANSRSTPLNTKNSQSGPWTMNSGTMACIFTPKTPGQSSRTSEPASTGAGRVQLIAQELARAVGWATEYYDRCKLTIQELNQHRRGKLKMIRKELRQRREAHTALLEEWHPHVMWLAKNCQPTAYCAVMLTNWQKMKAEMEFEKAGGMADRAEVNGALEEVVLDVALNDGEDVEDDQISGSDDDDMDVNVPPGITNDGVGI